MNEPLPEPECDSGYPLNQIEAMLGDRRDDFYRWFEGQTGSICDGRRYNHDTREYEHTRCGPHGMVVYSHDLRRYMDGLPVID